jgi:hypothetical protein
MIPAGSGPTGGPFPFGWLRTAVAGTLTGNGGYDGEMIAVTYPKEFAATPRSGSGTGLPCRR